MTYGPVQLYGYGLLLVLLVSGCSLVGAFFIPCMTQNARCGRAYFYLNTLMVSSAVSALFCDALLILIPEVFDLSGGVTATNVSSRVGTAIERDRTSSLWKVCMVICGVYIFYLLESLLHQCRGVEGKDSCDQHDHTLLHNGYDSLVITSDSELEYSESSSEKMSCLTTDSAGNPAIWHSDGYLEKETHKHVSICKIGPSKWCSWLREIKPLAWLIIIGDGLHNFADGIALGVAMTQGLSLGLSTAIAMIIHEIPHELGDFAILLSTGMRWPTALTLNFLHGLSAVVGFFIGVAIGTDIQQITGWILGATAGVFLYIALVDLLPSLIRPKKGMSELFFFVLTNVGMVTTFAVLLLLAVYKEEVNSLLIGH